MARPPIIAVSQRIDYLPDRNEYRDAVDQRLLAWLQLSGYLPAVVPNTLAIPEQPNLLEAWFEAISPAAILLSGGNDIGQYAMRDDTEHYLLDRASDRSLPVLGICRGLQMMAVWAGVELQAIEGHVATRHSLVLPDSESRSEWPQTVNSFHGWSLPATPEGFEVAALADDGSIEAIRHRKLPWEGWMWHPERETEFAPQDTRRMRKLFGG